VRGAQLALHARYPPRQGAAGGRRPGPAAAAASTKAGSAGAGAPVRAAEEGLVELQPRTDGCSERDMMGAHARGGARDGKARPSAARGVLSGGRAGRLAALHVASEYGLAMLCAWQRTVQQVGAEYGSSSEPRWS